MKSLSFSFALVMWICCIAVNAAESQEEFLEAYRAETKWLVEKYEHVHISARMEEVRGNVKRGTYNIEFFQDGSKIKIARNFASGDRISNFDATTIVVTPEKCFILQRPPGQPEYYVGLLGDKSNDEASSQAKLITRSYK
jgi:hypothetical protein